MSSAPRVMMFCRRNMYADESAAIGRALCDTFGISTVYVGAHGYTASATAPSDSTFPRASAPDEPNRYRRAISTGSMAIDTASNVAAIARDVLSIELLLRREQPDAIVVFDDRLLRPDLMAIRAARRRAIPSVLVPYAVSSPEGGLFVRRNDPRHRAPPRNSSPTARAIARWHPEQIRDGTLFYPAGLTLALGALGLLPPSPWLLGANGADNLCVLGSEHRDELLAAGIPEQRITATGQATTDSLALSAQARAELASTLRRRYGLPDGNPLLMCAVPQHAEHGMATWTSHRVATESLFSALGASGTAVLLSLHPKSDRAQYAEIASRHGLGILDERLSASLAAADLFVAAFSSTVRWAIGLGIPAVVIDDIKSGYQLYRNVAGVTVLDDHQSLAALLSGACRDVDTLAGMRAAAKRGRQQIGPIDGKASHRIAEVIAAAVIARSNARSVATATSNAARTIRGPIR